MRLTHTEILSADPTIEASAEFEKAMAEIRAAVAAVVHPAGTEQFTIYPSKNKKEGNGVVPIKQAFMSCLEEYGWKREQRPDVGVTRGKPGKIDVIKRLPSGIFAVEWETGNISSSHRALNKMVIGMQRGHLLAGMLILPTRKLYRYLTDRVGNYEELEPYFDVWRALTLNGVLGVIVTEHDATSFDVPRIPKGTDGRALV